MPSRVEHERSTGKRRERESRKEHNGDRSRHRSHHDSSGVAGRDGNSLKSSEEHRDEYLTTSKKPQKESQLAVYATVDKHKKSRHKNVENSTTYMEPSKHTEPETHNSKRSLGHRRSTELQAGSNKQYSDTGTSQVRQRNLTIIFTLISEIFNCILKASLCND